MIDSALGTYKGMSSDYLGANADEILETIQTYGVRTISKDDTVAAILMSPAAYEELLEDVRDAAIAEERLAHFDPTTGITSSELKQKYGITTELLAECEDDELE